MEAMLLSLFCGCFLKQTSQSLQLLPPLLVWKQGKRFRPAIPVQRQSTKWNPQVRAQQNDEFPGLLQKEKPLLQLALACTCLFSAWKTSNFASKPTQLIFLTSQNAPHSHRSPSKVCTKSAGQEVLLPACAGWSPNGPKPFFHRHLLPWETCTLSREHTKVLGNCYKRFSLASFSTKRNFFSVWNFPWDAKTFLPKRPRHLHANKGLFWGRGLFVAKPCPPPKWAHINCAQRLWGNLIGGCTAQHHLHHPGTCIQMSAPMLPANLAKDNCLLPETWAGIDQECQMLEHLERLHSLASWKSESFRGPQRLPPSPPVPWSPALPTLPIELCGICSQMFHVPCSNAAIRLSLNLGIHS